MKNISSKLLISLNLLGLLMVFSSNSWMSVWAGMEISSMTIPPLLSSMNNSTISKINSWKYYLTQCYASSIFLMCVLCMSFSSIMWMYAKMVWWMVIMSMLMKMGIFPFHGWMMQISSSIPWTMFLFLSSIQKIGPLIIISESLVINEITHSLLISCVISLMSMASMWTYSIRYFLITSSIINSAWMISSMQVSKPSFISFMMIYFTHLAIIFFSLEKEMHSDSLESTFMCQKNHFLVNLSKSLTIASMIGLPPLMGFFIKVSIIENLIAFNQYFSTFILSMSSSIIMLMYMKMIIMMVVSMRMELVQFKINRSILLWITIFLGPSYFLM